MHDFWVHVYNYLEHLHRDPVANVVIYSAVALFSAVLGLIFGTLSFSFLEGDYPCVSMSLDHNEVDRWSSDIDTCHLIMSFSLSIFTMVVASIGILAGEKHKPLIYSIFGGLGFVNVFIELYCFSAMITTLVNSRDFLSVREDSISVTAFMSIAVVAHFTAFYCIFSAVRNSWWINFHFTRQEKLVYIEQIRQRRGVEAGKKAGLDLGVGDLDDDHEMSHRGMVKGLGKMLADKERKQRRTIKNAELEKIEEEEDRRVVLEQKSNVF